MSDLFGQRKYVRPVGNVKIRNPHRGGARLPDGGDVVVIDEFWSRRIADGDVEVSDPPERSRKAAADLRGRRGEVVIDEFAHGGAGDIMMESVVPGAGENVGDAQIDPDEVRRAQMITIKPIEED